VDQKFMIVLTFLLGEPGCATYVNAIVTWNNYI